MAASKTSRPSRNPQDMLVGLNNIVKKTPISVTKEAPVEVQEIKNDIPPVSEEHPVYQSPKVNVEKVVKRAPGRPRKFKKDDKTEVIGVRLLDNEVRFLEEYGGKFGGKTGYVTYLVREEMKKKGVRIDEE